MGMPAKSATYASVVGVVLAEERERRVLTQAEAARHAKLTQSTWGRMELGRGCSLENLGKAAKALNIELWQLIKAVDDRAEGLTKTQQVQVVYELPSEEEIKANPDEWVSGNTLRTSSLMGIAAMAGTAAATAAMAGVATYVASLFSKDK